MMNRTAPQMKVYVELGSLGHIPRTAMFPSPQDVEALKSEFGVESIIERMEIRHLACCGTQAAAVITPLSSKEATLIHAWELIRGLARWTLDHTVELPATERYCVIVGWSQSVRRLQGQIFRACGDRERLQHIADATDWHQFEHTIRNNWEKDVFENHVA